MRLPSPPLGQRRLPLAALALALLTVSALVLHADDVPAADDNVAAHQGYSSARYEDLWTKSPFSVETPEQTVTESAEYSLVGVAQLDGVTYVSLIEKQNSNHILVSSDKPLEGLSLGTVTQKDDGTYATLTANGQLLTLKLEKAVGPGANPPGVMPGAMNTPPMPGMAPGMVNGVPQNIPMPGVGNQTPGRPMIRIRRPIIHVPPRMPNEQQGLPPGQPPGQPAPPPGANQ